jgi:hypothetical protein
MQPKCASASSEQVIAASPGVGANSRIRSWFAVELSAITVTRPTEARCRQTSACR